MPDRPEAWLLTVARRALGHRARHLEVRAKSRATLAMLAEAAEAAMAEARFPDERLKLLFVGAHPAIDPAARARAVGLATDPAVRAHLMARAGSRS